MNGVCTSGDVSKAACLYLYTYYVYLRGVHSCFTREVLSDIIQTVSD